MDQADLETMQKERVSLLAELRLVEGKYESLKARCDQLAKAWVNHGKGCEQLRDRWPITDEDKGYYRGCAVQATGCAGDLIRLLEQFDPPACGSMDST